MYPRSSIGRNPVDVTLLADIGLVGIVNCEMGGCEIGDLILAAQRRRETKSVAFVPSERHASTSTFIDELQPEPVVGVARIEQLREVLAIARHHHTAAVANVEARHGVVLSDDKDVAEEIDEPQREAWW